MSKRYNDTENFYGEQVEFTYEGRDYIWEGDYSVNTWGETSDYDYAGCSEVEVLIEDTTSLTYYDEATDDHIEVVPTKSIIYTIEIEIERNL